LGGLVSILGCQCGFLGGQARILNSQSSYSAGWCTLFFDADLQNAAGEHQEQGEEQRNKG
jgi:hypothetical protein